MLITPVSSFANVSLASADLTAISSRVIPAMADTLGIEESEIALQTKFEDLIAGDSTKIVELVQAMEIEFEDELDGEPIPEDVYPAWKTVEDAVLYLAGLGE